MQASEKPISFFHTIKLLYRSQGISRLYRGALAITLGCIPAHSAFFATYEVAKRKFGVDDGNYHFVRGLLVGACANISHDFFLTPMDVFKQRLQLTGCKQSFMYAKSIVKNEGIGALYRSLPVTILINLPYSSMIVCFNENIKTFMKPQKRKYKFFYYFVSAAISGIIASTLTNPLDVIKTRLQTQNTMAGMQADIIFDNVIHMKYRNFISTMRLIVQQEGLQGFAKGIAPRAIQASMSSAVAWVSYEIIKHFFLNKFTLF